MAKAAKQPDAPKIEKGIPLPDFQRGPSRATKYPYAQMVVGDSIFIATSKKSVSMHIMWATRTGFKFTFRQVDGGVRIWRIA